MPVSTEQQEKIHVVCVYCREGLEHCHGTLVVHPIGPAECSELSCAVPELYCHDLVVDCCAIEGGCGCVRLAAVREAS